VDVGGTNPKTGAVEYFQIKATDQTSGVTIVRRTKNVVIAVGGRPSIPKCLDANHPRVIHSSQYATTISHIFPTGTAPRAVAVIGAGQSAAEVFHNMPSRFPGCKSYLLIKGSALRPSDDSPL
jgi:L-ornithine N5-oxygenase